jgi:hypothetical protein
MVLKAATLASKKAAASDKRVSIIEKSLSEIKELCCCSSRALNGSNYIL